jgi:CO/xanthine dehydrogenase FAD-binding subunit
MRASPSDYQLIAPVSLTDALAILALEPGKWLPIAGGTDLMVLYAAGKLASRNLVSIAGLAELTRIEVLQNEIRLGSGCTYSELRQHSVVENEFPLLARAARWTGGTANQNRGTLGGNIANASPAADSLPALLAYEAELNLVSSSGQRRVPYITFHTGYKKMQLRPDELIQSVILKREFAGYFHYSRKVGARNAQAISKVCVAGLARLREGVIEDVRLALGSVAPIPLRVRAVEEAVTGKVVDDALIRAAQTAATNSIQPIDDIRSTATYRSAVVSNLIAEFFQQLVHGGHGK